MTDSLQRHTDGEHPMLSTVRAGGQAGTDSALDPTRLQVEQGIMGSRDHGSEDRAKAQPLEAGPRPDAAPRSAPPAHWPSPEGAPYGAASSTM